MNELQIFNSKEFGSVRTVNIDGESWFVGKDVARALGYSEPTKAVRKHVEPEDRWGSETDTPSITDSLGRTQYPTWINESGMYSLILSSKLQNAKKFKHWITSEVLPALRKTGTYTMPGKEQEKEAASLRDCMEAARMIAECGSDRLPYVLSVLGRAMPDTGDWTADVVGRMHRNRISGEDLAHACGYSTPYLSTVLNRHKKFKSPESAEKTKAKILKALCDIESGRVRDAGDFDSKKLDRHMTAIKLSSSKLATLAGYNDTTIRRWRNGQTVPGAEGRVALCRVLNLPPGYFDMK